MNVFSDHSRSTRISVTSQVIEELERVKGIEPSTRSLGSYCSTTELHPHRNDLLAHSRKVFRIISA